MNKNTNTKLSPLKMHVQQKQTSQTRTAFKLLPRASKLLDWLLDSTELSVAALFRIELSQDSLIGLQDSLVGVDDFLQELSTEAEDCESSKSNEELNETLKRHFSLIQIKLSQDGKRRSVALDNDTISKLNLQSKKWCTSRDVTVNSLIQRWALEWYDSIILDIEESGPKAQSVEKAYSLLLDSLPSFTPLKEKFNITDEQFWEELYSLQTGIVDMFYQDALGLIPQESSLVRLNLLARQYEQIAKKSE